MAQEVLGKTDGCALGHYVKAFRDVSYININGEAGTVAAGASLAKAWA